MERTPYVFLEIGPGRTISQLIRQQHELRPHQLILPVLSQASENEEMYSQAQALTTLGYLWSLGYEINWENMHEAAGPHRVRLPAYPFERQRYWLEYASEELKSYPQAVTPAMTYRRPGAPDSFVSPRTPTEEIVAEIWRGRLGIEGIGVFDDYYDLGGDSLMALDVLDSISTRLAVRLEIRDIIEASTIASLSVVIEARIREESIGSVSGNSPLVIMQATGKRKPLICIHPSGGLVLCYLGLAEHLGPDQPVWCFQSPGYYGAKEFTTIEECALAYVETLISHQPDGPYFLCGWSYGGNVAFEMARQLRQRGASVGPLIFFDSHPPFSYHYYRSDPEERDFLRAFPLVLHMYSGLNVKISNSDAIRQYIEEEDFTVVIEHLKRSSLLPKWLNLNDATKLFNAWKIHFRALRQYLPPPASYDGDIVIFRASEPQPDELKQLLRIYLPEHVEELGWRPLTTGQMIIHNVPGSHYTILNEPGLGLISPLLQELLAASNVGG